MALLIGLLIILIPILILLAIIGISLKLLWNIFLFCVVYFGLALLAIIIFPLFFPKKIRAEAYIGVTVVALVAECFMWYNLLFATHTIELPPSEEVATIEFISHSYEDAFWGNDGHWEQHESHSTSDPKYLHLLNENFDGMDFKRKLHVDKEQAKYYDEAYIYDDNGEILCTVTFYGNNVVSVKSGIFSKHYRYKDENARFNNAMDALETDIRKAEAAEKWQPFGEAFKNSVVYENDALSFTIPENMPDGYRIRTSLGKSQLNENGVIENLPMKMEWDVEDDQSWEQGATYSINLGEPLSYLDLIFTGDGIYELQVHAIELLPPEYVIAME